jgi:DNA-binding transcriptional ArsR family regulator
MATDDTRLDEIFRALADPTRRRLLRMVTDRPGMSTAQLAERTADMSRWGVMKHLGVLEAAGLIQTMPEGRLRRHFHEPQALDPVRRWLG